MFVKREKHSRRICFDTSLAQIGKLIPAMVSEQFLWVPFALYLEIKDRPTPGITDEARLLFKM